MTNSSEPDFHKPDDPSRDESEVLGTVEDYLLHDKPIPKGMAAFINAKKRSGFKVRCLEDAAELIQMYLDSKL